MLYLRQEQGRRERIAAATEELTDLRQRAGSPKSRIRKAAELDRRIEQILERHTVARYLKVRRSMREEHRFRELRSGRPGPQTAFRRISRRWPDLEGMLDDDAIERRFEQCKSVHKLAPVPLKNEGRIEALFTLYFVGPLVQALIERQLCLVMKRAGLRQLPIHPEKRKRSRPTTEQILRLFSLVEQDLLQRRGRVVDMFCVQLAPLQRRILELLGVPEVVFTPAS